MYTKYYSFLFCITRTLEMLPRPWYEVYSSSVLNGEYQNIVQWSHPSNVQMRSHVQVFHPFIDVRNTKAQNNLLSQIIFKTQMMLIIETLWKLCDLLQA